MNLRDRLFHVFGTDFQSSFADSGNLIHRPSEKFPLDREGCVLYEDFFFRLKDDFGFIMLLDLTVEEVNKKKTLIYQLVNLEFFFRLQVKVEIEESQFIPGLSSLWKSASPLEDDICRSFDLFISNGLMSEQRKTLQEKRPTLEGIRPVDQYSLPLRPRLEDFETQWHRFGPYEAPLNGKARIDFLHGRGQVHDVQIERGFHFRNFEKIVRDKSIFHLIYYFERMSMKDCVFAPLLFVETMEQRQNIEVPDKAKALRMVWMELARSENHLHFLWELTHELGFFSEASVFAELIEQVLHLYNLFSGKGQNFSLFTFGGMLKATPIGWGTESLEAAKYIYKVLEEVEGELLRNSRWMSETSGFSMSATDAIEMGVTGPNLRACGVNFDSRKSKPRYFYDDVDFEVPLGIDGTTYDRFLVRLHELKQSLRIINQVLDHLPAGSYLNKEHSLYNPLLEKQGVDLSLGGGDFTDIFVEEETFTTIEATEGQLGLFLHTNEEGIKHLHIRSPSLMHFSSYEGLVKGGTLNGAMTAFQSLNIDPWEMDR